MVSIQEKLELKRKNEKKPLPKLVSPIKRKIVLFMDDKFLLYAMIPIIGILLFFFILSFFDFYDLIWFFRTSPSMIDFFEPLFMTPGPGVVGIFLLLFVIVSLTLVYFKFQQNKVNIDTLLRHFIADVKKVDPTLSKKDFYKNTPKYKAAKHQLEINLYYVKDQGLPDYYDMDFAFGIITKKIMITNNYYQSLEFKETSMYQHHQNDWYLKKESWFRKKVNQIFKKDNEEYPINDPRRYALTEDERKKWWTIRVLTNSFVILIGFYLLSAILVVIGSNSDSQIILFLRKIVFVRTKNSEMRPLDWAFIFGVLYGNSLLLNGINILQQLTAQKLRINGIICEFVLDIKKYLPPETSDIDVLNALAGNDEQILVVKEKLRQDLKIKYKKSYTRKLPDYYDFAFAYGWLLIDDFVYTQNLGERYQATSVYKNHPFWSTRDYRMRYYGYHSGGSGSSGGSFGGGSFGGGGGTSGW